MPCFLSVSMVTRIPLKAPFTPSCFGFLGVIFFKKQTNNVFGGHIMSYFGATGLGFLVTSSLDFKARVGYLIHFCGGKCNGYSLRSTYGATPADLLTASMAARCLPTCISRRRTRYHCSTNLKLRTTCSRLASD